MPESRRGPQSAGKKCRIASDHEKKNSQLTVPAVLRSSASRSVRSTKRCWSAGGIWLGYEYESLLGGRTNQSEPVE